MPYHPDNPDLPDFSAEDRASANHKKPTGQASGNDKELFTSPVAPSVASKAESSEPVAAPLSSEPMEFPQATQPDPSIQIDQELIALQKRAQKLESERSAIEEKRRRQNEYRHGRKEMDGNFIRGIGLLQEEIIRAKRSVHLMENTLQSFSELQKKVQCLNEEDWTKDRYDDELSRALTVLENARMEWNSALVKIPVLDRAKSGNAFTNKESSLDNSSRSLLDMPSGEIMKMSIWLFWPLLLIAAILLLIFIALIR